MAQLFLLTVSSILILYLYSINKRYGFVGVNSSIIFAFTLYYFMIPFIGITYKPDLRGYNIILHAESNEYIEAYTLIVSFIISYIYVYRRSFLHDVKQGESIQYRKFYARCRFLGILTLLVGGVSFSLYASAFGGFRMLLMYAEYLRSFTTSAGEFVNYETMLLVVPARLITVCPIFLLFVASYSENKKIYMALFVVSLILAFLFHLSNAGKTGLLIFFLTFFVPTVSKWSRHPWRWTILFALIASSSIAVLDALFVSLSTGEELKFTTGESILSELSQFMYPISNVFHSGEIVARYGLRYGKDFITGVLNIIPSVNFEPSYIPTTRYYGGDNWTAGTPNDIITFAYLEFGVIGPFLIGALMGKIAGKLDNILCHLSISFSANVFKTALIVCMFTLVVNADVVSIVRNQFMVTLLSLTLLSSKTKKYKCEFYL